MALIDLSLPDDVVATDTLAALLETLEPQLSDAAVMTDSLALEADLALAIDDTAVVADSLSAELLPFVRVMDDSAMMADVIEALMEFGVGPVVVTSVTPQRGRTGDTVTIVGTGFAASNNNVRFAGANASIVSQSVTQIVVTIPSVTVEGGHAELQVSNFDTNGVLVVPFWIRNDVTVLQALRTVGQVPGPREDTTIDSEDAERAEARDHERLATVAEWLQFDLASTEGDIITRDATGLVGLDGSGDEGRVLLADAGEAAGIRWGEEVQATLLYGAQIPSGITAARELVANGEKDAVPASASEHGVPYAGTIDWAWVYQYTSGANADRLDRVVIRVNGADQYDSGTGLGIAHGEVFRVDPNVTVAAGDLVQLVVQKTGTANNMPVIGGLRVVAN